MARRDWKLIQALSSALGQSNTPRTIARAIGEALTPRWDARSVHLELGSGTGAQVITAFARGDRWISEHRETTTPPRKQEIPRLRTTKAGSTLVLPIEAGDFGGRLAVRFGPDGKRLQDDPDYLLALARIVEVGIGYQLLVQRVADRSRHAHIENRRLKQRLDPGELIARSRQMLAVAGRAAMVARYDTAVLVLGESGVGKEVVSRHIHRCSPRAKGPFVQVNCGAIPAQLVESELFGHERGAFTGAERAHRGVFQQAHRGVLLLDEVGELPRELQVKLLRVLQEGRVRPVGAESEVAVDVRVIAATNRPLDQMVATGDFRQDLYYRLDVFPIEVPPLRERPEDIAPLVSGLLTRLCHRLGIPIPTVSRTVMARLKAHSWPGNVRELSNVLEAAIILGGGRTLELADDFGRSARRSITPPSAVVSFRDAARAAIESALRSSNGKIYGADGAAVALDLHPATLQSKMRKLGIQRSAFVAETSGEK